MRKEGQLRVVCRQSKGKQRQKMTAVNTERMFSMGGWGGGVGGGIVHWYSICSRGN